MKVLLLGEFSGLHKYLKDGLEEIGLDVTLLANGDSWKRIDGFDDLLYRSDGNAIQRLFRTYIEPFTRTSAFSGYDVVQLINTICFHPIINSSLVSIIKKNSRLISLVAAGYDTRLYEKYMSGFFDYYMMDDADSVLKSFDKASLKGRIHQWNDYRIECLSDVIIPTAYEYMVGYNDLNKAVKVVPFPINVKDLEYHENCPGNRIVFFHGLNRELEKGTKYIRLALERLERKYPNDVKIIIDGHMPFNKYQEILSNANVILDQCKSYGYGINACISMAKGKVVMSGCRREHLESLGIDNCPIIEIRPDVEQIYSQLQYILENRASIAEYGERCREYVIKYHNYVAVARKYYNIWNRILGESGKYDNAE